MTIGTRTAGAWAYGSTSVATNLPTSVAAGDMMILFVGCKPYNATIAQPSGWTRIGTQQTNGTTASGTDTGSVTWSVFYRQFQTGDTAPTVSITSGGTAAATIFGFTKTEATWATPAAYFGSDTSAGTGYSVTASSSSGNVAAGDYLCAGTIQSGNDATLGTPTCSATGATIGTVTQAPSSNGSTNTGDDCASSGFYAPVSAGKATADAVLGYTLSGNQTGGSALVVVRELNRTLTPTVGALAFTGYAPTKGISHTRTPTKGAPAITGYAPTVKNETTAAHITREPAVGAVAITGHAPTVRRVESWAARTNAGNNWFRRVESGAQAEEPAVGALAVTGHAPEAKVATTGKTIETVVGAVAVAGHAPTVNLSYTFKTTTGAAAIAGHAPEIKIEAGRLAQPDPASLTAAGYAPGVRIAYTRTPAVGAVSIAGYAPSLKVTRSVYPEAGAVSVAGRTPTLGVSYVCRPATAALGVTGHAPDLLSSESLAVSFPFLANAQGFTSSAGAGTTMAWTGSDGNPLGSLQTATTGKGRNATNTWTLATDWATLGVPADHVVLGITAKSAQSKVTTWTNGSASTVAAVTLTPTGYPAITLAASRSVSAVDANWVTSTSADTTGLDIPSAGSLTITLGSNLRTPSTNPTPAVTLRQDNVEFRVFYTDAKRVDVYVAAVRLTGYAPQPILGSVETVNSWFARLTGAANTWAARYGQGSGSRGEPAVGALALTGHAPEAKIGSPTFRVSAGALALTGYAPQILGNPIVAAGADYLDAEPAAITAASTRVIPQTAVIRRPPVGALAFTGYAPVVTNTPIKRPFVAALEITGYAPTVNRDYTVTTTVGTLALTGYAPEPRLGSKTIRPTTGQLGIAGHVLTMPERPVFEPVTGAATFTGYVPTVSIGFRLGQVAGALTLTGHAPDLLRGIGKRTVATTLTLTGHAPQVAAVAIWRVTATLTPQPATTSATTKVIRKTSASLQAPPPLLVSGTGKRVLRGSGTLQAGPGSLKGGVRGVSAELTPEPAILYARVRQIDYEPPTRRMKPQRVNRYAVALKPSPRLRIRRPNSRRPMQ